MVRIASFLSLVARICRNCEVSYNDGRAVLFALAELLVYNVENVLFIVVVVVIIIIIISSSSSSSIIIIYSSKEKQSDKRNS